MRASYSPCVTSYLPIQYGWVSVTRKLPRWKAPGWIKTMFVIGLLFSVVEGFEADVDGAWRLQPKQNARSAHVVRIKCQYCRGIRQFSDNGATMSGAKYLRIRKQFYRGW